MTKKELAKELLERFQKSHADTIIPCSASDGFMTDSEATRNAIQETLYILGLEDLVRVEEELHWSILHYVFHLNTEEDLEELRAKQDVPPIELRVYLEDNEIDSVYASGNIPIVVTEVQLMGNEYDDDVDEYMSAVNAHKKETAEDPNFTKAEKPYFDWAAWAKTHPELVDEMGEEDDEDDDW